MAMADRTIGKGNRFGRKLNLVVAPPEMCKTVHDFIVVAAIDVARELMRQGFPVGPSSGLNFRAAWIAAERLKIAGNIVTVFPDRMERYFTTEMFAPYR